MGTRISYFKIGLFVLIAAVLATIGVVVLGAGIAFRPKILVETYVNESVNGLDVGSAVRYRGVQVGSVKSLGFVHTEYLEQSELVEGARYVLVRFSFYPASLGGHLQESVPAFIRMEVSRGLRCRLASVGLTGALYLEIDYLDPVRNPPLEISWSPKYLYVPSAPSTITRLGDMLEGILSKLDMVLTKLENLALEKILKDMDDLLVAISEEIRAAQLGDLHDKAAQLLASLQDSNRRFKEILDSPELRTILTDFSHSASGARSVVEDVQGELGGMLEDLTAALEKFDRAAGSLDALLSGADVTGASARLHSSLRRFDAILASQHRNIEAILENLREVSEELKALSREARDNPSQVLFGDPPPPSRPER